LVQSYNISDVIMTIRLSLVTILKTKTNEQETPKQKPVNPIDNRWISQIDLGNPKD